MTRQSKFVIDFFSLFFWHLLRKETTDIVSPLLTGLADSTVQTDGPLTQVGNHVGQINPGYLFLARNNQILALVGLT